MFWDFTKTDWQKKLLIIKVPYWLCTDILPIASNLQMRRMRWKWRQRILVLWIIHLCFQTNYWQHIQYKAKELRKVIRKTLWKRLCKVLLPFCCVFGIVILSRRFFSQNYLTSVYFADCNSDSSISSTSTGRPSKKLMGWPWVMSKSFSIRIPMFSSGI